jgi:hypothetical protein
MREIAPWKVVNSHIYVVVVLLSIPLGSFVGITFFAWGAGALGSLIGPLAVSIGLIVGYCLSVWLFALAGALFANLLSLLLIPRHESAEAAQSSLLACLFLLCTPLVGAMFWFLLSVVTDSARSARTGAEVKQWVRYYEKAGGDPEKALILQVENALKENTQPSDEGLAQEVDSKLKSWMAETKEKDLAFRAKKMYFQAVFNRAMKDRNLDTRDLNDLLMALEKKGTEITKEDWKSLQKDAH